MSETKNPIVAAVVLIQDDKYLLIQEKKPTAFGLWNFPAGKLDQFETIEEAAVREAKEETGYDVRLIKHIATYPSEAQHPERHVFYAEIVGGDLQIREDEIMDAQWFTLSEIEAMQDKLRGLWILETLKTLKANP